MWCQRDHILHGRENPGCRSSGSTGENQKSTLAIGDVHRGVVDRNVVGPSGCVIVLDLLNHRSTACATGHRRTEQQSCDPDEKWPHSLQSKLERPQRPQKNYLNPSRPLRSPWFDFRQGHLLFSTLVMTVQKIKSLDEIVLIRNQLRREGKKLVFTNGCFDLLHAGHVRYLNQARALGDVLVVAVNSDRSVREIKGEGRPITPEDERAEVLAALACVDYVFLFGDLTPQRVIGAIVPDILAKGADWETSEIVGRQTVEGAGGTVRRIPLVEGISTSAIIRNVLTRFGSRRAR